jgi:phage-related protein
LLIQKYPEVAGVVFLLVDSRIARVLFTLKKNVMVLLHGFIKKSQATSKDDLKTALANKIHTSCCLKPFAG